MRNVLPLSCLALSLVSTSAFAGPLSPEEERYVIGATNVMIVLVECPGYSPLPDGLMKFADRTGVDFTKFSSAMAETVKVMGKIDYDRSALIPEVTRKMKSVMENTLTNMKHDKKTTCKKWGDLLAENGVIQKRK